MEANEKVQLEDLSKNEGSGSEAGPDENIKNELELKSPEKPKRKSTRKKKSEDQGS